MKIKCTWLFKEYRPGIKTAQLGAKAKYIENMSPEEVMEMITTLLAQTETTRLIFEVGNDKESN